jgi:heme O synthase-like polyprenyltransferase
MSGNRLTAARAILVAAILTFAVAVMLELTGHDGWLVIGLGMLLLGATLIALSEPR